MCSSKPSRKHGRAVEEPSEGDQHLRSLSSQMASDSEHRGTRRTSDVEGARARREIVTVTYDGSPEMDYVNGSVVEPKPLGERNGHVREGTSFQRVDEQSPTAAGTHQANVLAGAGVTVCWLISCDPIRLLASATSVAMPPAASDGPNYER